MKFFTSPSSPFGRKVKIAAHVLGLCDEFVEFPINTLDPDSGICDINPLGKIPALEDNGSTLYDSRVIMEYLDLKAGGGKIIPPAGSARPAHPCQSQGLAARYALCRPMLPR